MPDINNTFMSGKMNKDLDERLVQKHEYTDAQNVEVTTSDGSNVGSLQNTYGNTVKSKISAFVGDSKCVGSIVDNENDKIYWFVRGDSLNLIKNSNATVDSDWTTSGNSSIDTDNGVFVFGEDVTSTSQPIIMQEGVDLVIGQEYTITFDVTSITTSSNHTEHPKLWLRQLNDSGSFEYQSMTGSDTVGAVSHTFTADVDYIRIGQFGTTFESVTKIDNICIINKNVDCIAEYDSITDAVVPVLVDAHTNPEGKFLKFPKTQITGINILDGMLFWTDGVNEPKKINIDHFKGGSNLSVTGSTDEKLNWTTTTKQRDFNNQIIGDVLERDVTVIKKYPLNAPSLALSDTVHGEPDLNAKSKSICVNPPNTTYTYNKSHWYGSNETEFYHQCFMAKIKSQANTANLYNKYTGYEHKYSLHFNRADKTRLLLPSDINPGKTCTFSAWVKFDDDGNFNSTASGFKHQNIFGYNEASTMSNQFLFGRFYSSSLAAHTWYVVVGNSSFHVPLANHTPLVSTWHYVAVTLTETATGTDVKVYVDPTKDNQAPIYSASIASQMPSGVGDLWTIGGEFDAGPTMSDVFQGNISRPAIWNTALTDSQIYYSGTRWWTDLSVDGGGIDNHTGYDAASNLIAFYSFDQGYGKDIKNDASGKTAITHLAHAQSDSGNWPTEANTASWSTDGPWLTSNHSSHRDRRLYQIDLDVLEDNGWINPAEDSDPRYPISLSTYYSAHPNVHADLLELKNNPEATKHGYRAFRSLFAKSSYAYYNVYVCSPTGFDYAGGTSYIRYTGSSWYIDGNGRVILSTNRSKYFEGYEVSSNDSAYIPQEGDILIFLPWDSFNNQSFWTYRHEETNEIVPKPPGTSNTPRVDKEGRWLRDYIATQEFTLPKLDSEVQQGLFHYQSRAFDFETGWEGTADGYVHTKRATTSNTEVDLIDNVAYNVTAGTNVQIRATVEITSIDSSVYVPGVDNISPVGFSTFNGISTYARVPKGAGVGTYQIGTYGNDQSDLVDGVNSEGKIKIFCMRGVTATIKNLSITQYGERAVRIQDLTFSPKPNFTEGDIVKLTNQTDRDVQIQLKLKKEKLSGDNQGYLESWNAVENFNVGFTRGADMIHTEAALPGSGALSTPNNCYLYWTSDPTKWPDLQGSLASGRTVWSHPSSTNSTHGYLYPNYYTYYQKGWVEYNALGTDTDFLLKQGETYELVYTVNDSNSIDEGQKAKLYLQDVYDTSGKNGVYFNNLLLPSSSGTHRVFWTQCKDSTKLRFVADRGHIKGDDGVPSPAALNGQPASSLTGGVNSYFREHLTNIQVYPITKTTTTFGGRGSNSERSTFECEILSISDDIVKLDINQQRYWDAELTELESIYKFRFPRFAYRWRYKDGEYSAMSPFTEVAFLPGDEYEFDAIDSYNKTMLNTVRRITLGNFQNKPAGVKQLDILVKDSDSPNIYKFASIRGDELANLNDYSITSEQYEGLLEAAQLLRHFDNVPKKAKAQEISSNRLIYGNYTQQYDILDSELPKVSASARSLYITPKETNKSIKSIRNYQLGIAYIDSYGRQTPVFSTPNGVVKIQKENSVTANEIVANVAGFAPDWATHMKYYVKDAATEYYNLSLDRHYYDDDDEHIWMSFASSDFDKVERDDYIVLKKEHDGDSSIVDKSRYKILAKEPSAPDFVKFVKRKLGERVFAANGQSLQFTASAVGFPQVGKTTFRVSGEDIHNHSFLAQPDIEGVEPRGALMDDQTGKFIKIGKEVNSEVQAMTSYYEILSVSRVNASAAATDTDFSDSEDYYEFTLIEPFGADIGFVGAHSDTSPENKGLFFEYYEESDRVDSDAFEGRFFVKIKKDSEILKRISDKNESAVTTNTLVTAAANMFWAHTFDSNIAANTSYLGDSTEDGKDGDYTLRDKSLFHWKSNKAQATAFDGIYNGVTADHNSGPSNSPTTANSWFPQAIFGHDGWITEPSTANDWNGRIYTLADWDNNKAIHITNPYFGDYSASTAHWSDSSKKAPATGGTWKRSHWRSDEYTEGTQKFCIDQAWAMGWGDSKKLYPGQNTANENTALGTGFVIGNDYCCFRVANIGNQIPLESVMVNGSESGDVLYARGANTFDDFALTNEFFNDIKVVKALTTPGTKFRWSNDPTNTVYSIKSVVNTGKVRNYHNVQQEFGYGDLVDWTTTQALAAADNTAINGYFVADYGLSYHPESSTQWGMHSRSNQGYRIALELDKQIVWSPTSTSYNGGQTPLKRLDQLEADTADSLAFSSLEIISSGSSSDGGYSTDNPAIFEVEPIDNTDFNLYYEAANTSLILKTGMKVEALNNKNVNDGGSGGNYNDLNDAGTTYAPSGVALLQNSTIIVDKPGEFSIDANTWDDSNGMIPAGITLRVSKLDANGDVEYFEDFINKTGIANSIGDNLVVNDDFVLSVGSTNVPSNFTISTGMTADNSTGNGATFTNGTSTIDYPSIKSDPITIVSGEPYQLVVDIAAVDNDVTGVGNETTWHYFVLGSENSSYRPVYQVDIDEAKTYTSTLVFDESQNEDIDENPVSKCVIVFECGNWDGADKSITINSVSLRTFGDVVDVNDVPVRWHNCYTFGNGVESDRLRDDYNAVRIDKGPKVSTTIDEPYEEEERKNGLIYSGLFNSKTVFNKLNEFIMGLKITKDVNPEYGSIQKLFSRNTDLVTFCEDKVLRILSNKDALYNADGNPQVVASNAVLGQAVPFAGDFGISTNPESFASFGYRAYFTDKARGEVLRLSMDGLTPISRAGMARFFKDTLPVASDIVGTYNQDKDLYNITLDGKTISFAESTNGWTSFKSFIPESAVSLNGKYYTFKNGDIWLHDKEQVRNNFYGVQYETSVKFLLNDASSIVKDFRTLSYEGSDARELSNESLDAGQVTKRGWYAPSVKGSETQGQVIQFKNKEGKKFANIVGESLDDNNIDLKESSIQGLGTLHSVELSGYEEYMDFNIKAVSSGALPKAGLTDLGGGQIVDGQFVLDSSISIGSDAVSPTANSGDQFAMLGLEYYAPTSDASLLLDDGTSGLAPTFTERGIITGVADSLIPGNRYYIEAFVKDWSVYPSTLIQNPGNQGLVGFSSLNMVEYSDTRYRADNGKICTEFIYSPDVNTNVPSGVHLFREKDFLGRISSLRCYNLESYSDANKWTISKSASSAEGGSEYVESVVADGNSTSVNKEFYIHPKTVNGVKYALSASDITVTFPSVGNTTDDDLSLVNKIDTGVTGTSTNVVKITVECALSTDLVGTYETKLISISGDAKLAIDQ